MRLIELLLSDHCSVFVLQKLRLLTAADTPCIFSLSALEGAGNYESHIREDLGSERHGEPGKGAVNLPPPARNVGEGLGGCLLNDKSLDVCGRDMSERSLPQVRQCWTQWAFLCPETQMRWLKEHPNQQ